MSNYFMQFVRSWFILPLAFFATGAFAQETGLIAGQNINMVSGTEWPNGDPFLQRQNEPTIAVSTRNPLHLMGGSNDYRTVDLPGLPEGKTTGDSWISAYFSSDEGGRWTSTLLPGYPQDNSALGLASPLSMFGYEASADPVIRPGTHGLFYYSGIAFTRGDDPPSAGFVATYMDLNNDERGNSIGYVRTTLFDQNTDGSSFIDKPWIAVDKPRNSPNIRTLDVNSDIGVVAQTVECGNLYAAYARIQGEDSASIRSQIMFTRSEDCAETFSEPKQLTLPDTINQGAAIAIEPNSGRIQVAWRQFENATMNCTYRPKFWRRNPEAWPVDQLELAGYLALKENGGIITVASDDDDDDDDDEDGGQGEDDDDDEDEDEDEDENDSHNDKKSNTPSKVFKQLLAAWLNILSGADSTAVTQTLEDAEAWLGENPIGTKPKKKAKKEGKALLKILRDYNKGKIGPGSCDDLLGDGTNGMLSGMNPNAIMLVTSSDGGDTFSEPVAISGPNYFPFEQGTTEFSFRSTGYPTMTFDGVGRSYVAYTTRGLAVPDFDEIGGDGRIVVTTSTDGANWTFPLPIDEPEQPGHQLMPALESSRGKVFLLYYDFRSDVSGVFDRFVTDLPVDFTTPRHSVDVRAAEADAAEIPVFTDYSVLNEPSTQASRYPFLILDNAGEPFSQQMQYNPPNLPMFRGGLVPFFGDFIDLATLHFVNDGMGNWDFDTDPATGSPVVHAVWTDNRDVVAPLDGDWSSYVPPGDGTPRDSIFDPGQTVPVCSPADDPFVVDRTKMRNQNIYTSRLTEGLAVAIPGNNRPLGTIQRVFVGFVQNLTNEDKLFRLQILNQPIGGSASFDQFVPETLRDEVVERNSSIARSIYVSSTDPSASIDLRVTEVDSSGNPVPGGLAATTRINPDPSAPNPQEGNILAEEIYTPAIFNPAIFNPAIFNSSLLGTDEVGIFNPAIFNPAIFNDPEQAEFITAALTQLALLNPAIFNPAIFNPAIFNPAIFNPAIFNPAIFNPAIFNPAIFNPAIFNLDPANPAIFNPAIFNPAIFNSTLVETSIVVENNGNATAAYSLNLDLENPPDGFLFQVMVYRTYLVPAVDGCDLTETVEQEQLVNELTPDVNGSLLNPDSTSFFIAPGDNVVVTVRVVPDPNAAIPGDPTTIDTLSELDLSQSVVPQAVDTEGLDNGETEPKPAVILAPSLPPLVVNAVGLADGIVGAAYSATLGTSGGGGTPVNWLLVPGSVLPGGLSLSLAGQIVGTPTTVGVFTFDVRAQDDDQVAEQGFSIIVNPGGLPALPLDSESSAFGADTITFDPSTGLRWLDVPLSAAFSYDEILLEFAPGGTFEEFRLATSTETFDFWQNAGINTGAGFVNVFTPENFQPVVDLMAFVGITGLNTGNLGGGNFFDFTAGHVESGPGGSGDVNVATISADPDPTVTGRPDIGTVPSNNSNNQHGAWLVYGASISDVALSTTTLIIEGDSATYTADIENVTGLTLSIAVVQSWIDQGSATRAAGGVQVTCGAGIGELPPGSCTIGFSLNANNTTSAGSGTLVAGAATARFELIVNGTVFQTFSVPITLLDAGSPATTTWRADFDFSGSTPAAPYDCLRQQFVFNNPLGIGESIDIEIFDVEGGPVIGSLTIVNSFAFPIDNLGQEVFVSSTSLVDGVGFELLTFSQPIDLQSLMLQGQIPCTGASVTPFVSTILTPNP